MRLRESIEQLEEKEEVLRQQVKSLTDEQRKAYYTQLSKRLKDPDTYATLNWFFLGGLHHCYLRKYTLFAIEITLLIIGIIGIASGHTIAWLIIAGLFIYELPHLFFSQKIARQYNYDVSCEILKEVRTL